jgi:fructose-1-phosphate kinase PfkB-like protein
MAAIVTLTMNPALDIATSTDRVVPTRKLRCEAPRYDPGCGGINVARAVHALGGDALAIFPAGGSAGEMIGHLLHIEGVLHHVIQIAGSRARALPSRSARPAISAASCRRGRRSAQPTRNVVSTGLSPR